MACSRLLANALDRVISSSDTRDMTQGSKAIQEGFSKMYQDKLNGTTDNIDNSFRSNTVARDNIGRALLEKSIKGGNNGL